MDLIGFGNQPFQNQGHQWKLQAAISMLVMVPDGIPQNYVQQINLPFDLCKIQGSHTPWVLTHPGLLARRIGFIPQIRGQKWKLEAENPPAYLLDKN